MSKKPANPVAYAKVRDGLLRLHELMVKGEIESDEAEAIRDATDKPWLQVNDEQRAMLNALSRDLLVVADVQSEATPIPEDNAELNELSVKILKLAEERRFEEALTQIATNKAKIPVSVASHMRGIVWETRNEPTVAIVFFRHAHVLQPTRDVFYSRYLVTLNLIDSKPAVPEASKALDEFKKYEQSRNVQNLTLK